MVQKTLGIDPKGQKYRLMNMIPTEPRAETRVLDHLRDTIEREQRVDAWVDTLTKRPWTLFATLTFRRKVSAATADKLFRKWINGLNRVIFGGHYYKHKDVNNGGLYWVRATERMKDGSIHYHAVIGGDHARPKQLDAVLSATRWQKLAGNAKIDYYDSRRAGLAYAVKSARRSDYTIDLSDNFNIAPARNYQQA